MIGNKVKKVTFIMNEKIQKFRFEIVSIVVRIWICGEDNFFLLFNNLLFRRRF